MFFTPFTDISSGEIIFPFKDDTSGWTIAEVAEETGLDPSYENLVKKKIFKCGKKPCYCCRKKL